MTVYTITLRQRNTSYLSFVELKCMICPNLGFN